ncbi:corticotropin-releasing factor receptor 1-like isoform X2 [Panonychus citri]|uniref:corticotropin-releasing factor receptor 1-like isoform X2 n=1 Tax=Panonychus citri TaxID=50023 RepID=UPI0023072FDF|nr:corticotropin-releasing factor receptor 1-like isoform X2 [Panonychus citri]
MSLESEDMLRQSCLNRHNETTELTDNHESWCSAIWDGVYCWPPVKANTRIRISCHTIFETSKLNVQSSYIYSDPEAFRHCDSSGNWSNGNWTNYTQCLSLLSPSSDKSVPYVIGYILFICSSISIVLLLTTMFIFLHFKKLECPRLRVHRNLVFALIVHCLALLIISSSIVFDNHFQFARENSILCKLVLSMKMYSALSSINWMFIEGLLLHSRVTTGIFRKSFPFRLYYAIGWGIPLFIILTWAYIVNQTLHSRCWEGYGDRATIWIITAPMILALLINSTFLVNIIRILVTQLNRNRSEETNKIRKAIKATILLFPLLGTTHLLFCFNPKNNKELEIAYMITNAILQSSQGIFVSFFYCFADSEVQRAIRHTIKRGYLGRSSTVNSMRSCSARNNLKNLEIIR